jgi:asparagine synthase (glutamine-hydrolysing)
MRLGYVPAPHTIYSNVLKLDAGHYLELSDSEREIPDPKCYWNLPDIALSSHNSTVATENELIENLDALLHDSVAKRLVADVPVGALLSGGIDSTVITAIAQSQSVRPIKTYSIGFDEPHHDEAPHAKAVARSLGTAHTELYVTSKQALDVIPQLAIVYDEPFADSSQIPTLLLSKLVRRDVIVALSGDGGDEVFGGYNRYHMGYRTWDFLQRSPSAFRSTLSGILEGEFANLLESLQALIPRRFLLSYLTDRLPKLATALRHPSAFAYYESVVSAWPDARQVVLGNPSELPIPNLLRIWSSQLKPQEKMMLADMLTYLPNDILTKVDRASMATSLEVRIPILDHRIIEFSCSVPLKFKIRGGQGKWLLRRVLDQYVPRKLMERPKQGFGIPLAQWLRGPLVDWAEDLLDTDKIKGDGILNSSLVRSLWNEHLLGKRNHESALWNILMFQSWKTQWY